MLSGLAQKAWRKTRCSVGSVTVAAGDPAATNSNYHPICFRAGGSHAIAIPPPSGRGSLYTTRRTAEDFIALAPKNLRREDRLEGSLNSCRPGPRARLLPESADKRLFLPYLFVQEQKDMASGGKARCRNCQSHVLARRPGAPYNERPLPLTETWKGRRFL